MSNRIAAPFARDVLMRFRAGELSADEAAGLLGISRSQFYRVRTGFLTAVGDHQEASWSPGVSGGDHHPPLPTEVQTLVDRLLAGSPPPSYSLIASEVQRRFGIQVDRATVRRRALAQGLAPDTRWKHKPKPIRRFQVPRVGQLWQYDVSPHRWLPGWDNLFPLFDILDDCSRVVTGARIYPAETLLAHLDFLSSTFLREGLPLALYVDHHSFFFTQRPERLTQLGESLRFYGVTLLYAPTPQAKGKIERLHQFWQNRLPPLFAAEQITQMAAANALLEDLRLHHNQHEVHRELGCPPRPAWEQAVRENRSSMRSPPVCPWWRYVFTIRSTLRVADDGTIPLNGARLHLNVTPGLRVVRCLHPNGEVSVLLRRPEPGTLPLLVFHQPPPKPPPQLVAL